MGILNPWRKRRKLVDFMIIGGQKCGTSSLFDYLNFHPNIIGSKSKETNYFAFDELYNKGISTYNTFFPKDGNQKNSLLFEASVSYMYFPYIPRRLYKYNSNLKLIILLRNPIDRAYSAWNMFRLFHHTEDKSKWYANENIINSYFCRLNSKYSKSAISILKRHNFPSFEHSVLQEISLIEKQGIQFIEPGFISKGIYHIQLTNLLKFFSKSNIYILDTSCLKDNTEDELNKILKFLNLPDCDWSSYRFEHSLKGQYDSFLNTTTRPLLNNFFSEHNKLLYKILGKDFNWS